MWELVRHVSFVDCPGARCRGAQGACAGALTSCVTIDWRGRAGHDILMATMLNGAAVMDAALLLIAGDNGRARRG